MRVLIAYASRHGATRGIAERIADRLRAAGVEVDVHPAASAPDPVLYDAVVIGGAAYMFHWLKDATRFVERHRTILAARPVWLFSSGPLGTDTIDAKGRDVFATSEPKEFARLVGALHPRGVRVFFGAFDAAAPPIGLAERFARHLPATRDAMPVGDFRDWTAIDAWADEIAAEIPSTAEAEAVAVAGR
jgi:menaquinone-dependent protoporphyrinogen oxidase